MSYSAEQKRRALCLDIAQGLLKTATELIEGRVHSTTYQFIVDLEEGPAGRSGFVSVQVPEQAISKKVEYTSMPMNLGQAGHNV